VVITLAMMSCTLGGEDTKKLPELQRIAAETPVFPGCSEMGSRHMGKRENAGLTYFYSSSANYEEVKKFYISALVPKGWSYPTEQSVPKWFIDDGSKALTFRKGEYTIEVEYDAAKEARVPFSVDFGWEMPGW
jgi:hypothetical protein